MVEVYRPLHAKVTMSAFDQAFTIVIGHEGGYTNNPRDPGNWTGGECGVGECRGTNWGLSAAAYPDLNIRDVYRDEAKGFYRRDYWAPIAGDMLPPPLALLVFDAAVNNGVGRATRWLQTSLNVKPDGQIGPQTLGALAVHNGGAALCAEYMAQRLNFMSRLPTWGTFGLGWSRRLCALPYESIHMVQTK